MKNETARREVESLDYYLQYHTVGYSEESHMAMMMAIKALEQVDKMFFISEILVRESKCEITPEKALNQIRDILIGYTFWDKENEDAE